MRKHIFRFLGLLILIAGFTLTTPVMGQNGDPPPPPAQHGETGNQPVGGGAPIGEGLAILTLLSAGYGARKWYLKHKRTLAE